MTDRPVTAVEVAAPAKLNLGLEILGRRPDGYHDLVTIFQAINLTDDLRLEPTAEPLVRCCLPGIPEEQNLAVRALTAIRPEDAPGARLSITKRIPSAAGIGGASSDAAAALRAGKALWHAPVSDAELASLALALGSDVPFFLECGTALATGRGEQLTPLPPLVGVWFVVVAPRVTLPRKTPTLFSLLRPDDFSDGRRTEAHAARIADGLPIDPASLGNAFARPLSEALPAVANLPARLRGLGAPNAALSGAGPSHYVTLTDPDHALHFARRARAVLAEFADVFVCQPVPRPPALKMTYL